MATPNLSSQPGNRYSNPATFAPGVHSIEEGQPSVSIGMTVGLSASNRAEMHDAVTQGMTMGLSATVIGRIEESVSIGMQMGLSASNLLIVPLSVTSGMSMGLSAVLGGLAPVPPDPPAPPIACQEPDVPAYTPALISYPEPSERTGS